MDTIRTSNVLPNEEAHRRVGHIVVSYHHFILVWGGFKGEETDYCPPDHLWRYNCLTEVWSLAQTKGEVPYKGSGCTGVIKDNYLYIFGGVEQLNEVSWRYGNDLHRLNLDSFVWEKLKTMEERPIGCDKGVGWSYENRLYFFGGYGVVPRPEVGGVILGSRRREMWTRDVSTRQWGRGWTNQSVFWEDGNEDGDKMGRWSSWLCKSGGPGPRAASAVALSPKTAPRPTLLLFGGRHEEERMNDLYALDLKTMQWSGNLTLGASWSGEVPEGKSWHSLDFVDDHTVVLYGGLNQDSTPSDDWWTFKISYGNSIEEFVVISWTRREIPSPLVWHKSTFSQITKELILVGGITTSPYRMTVADHVDCLHIIQFQPSSLLRLCLKFIVRDMKSITSSPPHCLTLSLPPVLLALIIARVQSNSYQ